MKLTTLSDNTLLLEQHRASSRQILRESCSGLTIEQRTVVEGIYNELRPLVEATLTAQQIQQLFGEVEKQATAGGDNRTMLGMGVDAGKKVNDTINNVGKWLQNTKPVQAFDQKFEQLKTKVSTKFPQLEKQLTAMGTWAKENPGKTAAIIGVLTTLASVAGGPVGGALAGQILKGTTELLKGEKLSTAIGKGAKAAALGWLTGKAVDFIGKALTDPIMSQATEMGNDIVTSNYTRTIDEIGGKFGSRFGTFSTGELFGRASDVRDIKDVYAAGVDAWKAGDYLRADSMFKSAAELTDALSKPEYIDAIAATVDKAQMMQAGAEEMKKFFGAMSTVAQGAATGATGAAGAKKESYYIQTRPLSEGQVYMMFNRVEYLTEGPMDMLKKGAEWVGKKAGNLTTKVTADKLNSAWKKAGSPMDSDAVAGILKAQGVDINVVSQVFKSMKLAVPGVGAATAPATDLQQAQSLYLQVKDQISKVDKKGRQRLTAYLQKQLGTA
jgi:hypothetical protein